MRGAGLQPLFTNHAHPSPLKATTPNEAPSFRDLLANVTIKIELSGLTAKPHTTPSEMYCPQVRRSLFTEQVISHLDVVSCWKGISYAQAVELTIWERFFRLCLASQVQERLQDLIINHLSQSEKQIDNIPLLLCLISSFLDDRHCLVDIDVTRLVHQMIECLYDNYCSDNVRRYLKWSLGSGDLPSFVYNFVRTQDCFLHSLTGPCLAVDLSSRCDTSAMLAVVADLVWQPPNISFRDVPKYLRAGEHYYIAPYRVDSDLAHNLVPFRLVAETIHYTMPPSSFPLQWDPSEKAFQGLVPCTSGKQGGSFVLDTVLSAHIVMHFPKNVRFERTSRYSVKLEINQLSSPYSSQTIQSQSERPQTAMRSWAPSVANSFSSKTRSNESSVNEECFTDPVKSFHEAEMEIYETDEDDDLFIGAETTSPVLRKLSLSTSASQSQSLKKRKASQPKIPSPELSGHFALDRLQHRDLEIESKRQKIEHEQSLGLWLATPTHSPNRSDEQFQFEDLAVQDSNPMDPVQDYPIESHLTNFFTGHMGEAQKSPPFLVDRRADMKPRSPHQHGKPIAAKPKGKFKQTVFSWNRGDRSPTDIKPPLEHTADSDSSSLGKSSPNTALPSSHTKNSTELSQAQIQHNYKEFEEQAKRKAAEKAYYSAAIPSFDGVLSPTDAIDFERAFLEDSEAEDWMSEIDGLSEGLESVSMVE